MRLVKGWQVDSKAEQSENSKLAVDWFNARFNQALAQTEDHYSKYRLLMPNDSIQIDLGRLLFVVFGNDQAANESSDRQAYL